MNHGSLFSGIGGFDLAAEWAGWDNKFHCEWNDFGQKILKYYWPQAESYGDITKTDFRKWRGQIDVLTGGFPCQPFSQAGKRAGAEDDRYLWPEMLRAIEEIRPTWVIGENVAGITTMVQPYTETKMENQASIFEASANIITEEAEFVVETVCSDLERIGYAVQPIIIPACAVGAPHRRDRIWFIAHCNSKQRERQEEGFFSEFINGGGKVTPNTNKRKVQSDRRDSRKIPPDWENFPTQPPVCGGNDGISREMDGITFPRWRNESIKAYGNAIVPQVAFEIFKGINEVQNN